MAFICLLNDKIGWGDIGVSDAKVYASTVVGYDDETEHTYQLYVSFDRQNVGYWEMSFYIEEYDDIDNSIDIFFRGTETKSFLNTNDRMVVLMNVISIIKVILDQHSFETCIFYSIDLSPPPKALLKYNLICAVFFSFQYSVSHEIASDGQHIWKFERPAL